MVCRKRFTGGCTAAILLQVGVAHGILNVVPVGMPWRRPDAGAEHAGQQQKRGETHFPSDLHVGKERQRAEHETSGEWADPGTPDQIEQSHNLTLCSVTYIT